MSVVRKSMSTKIPVSEELNKKRLMLISSCAVCSKEKLSFMKNQEASGLLSKLGSRTPIINIPLIDNISF